MTKIVKGGIVSRVGEPDKSAVPVETITFPDVGPNVTVPPGSHGTLIVSRVPQTPYTKADTLFYRDSNHHNDTNMTIDSVSGPTKFKITTR